MKLAYITYEFSAGTFSGNGILARTQIRSLSSLGHEILVIYARHVDEIGESCSEGAAQLIELVVPSWYKLDGDSCWQEFGEGCSTEEVLHQIVKFDPQFILGVDWTSLTPYMNIKKHYEQKLKKIPPRFVFMNFRVFSRTENTDQKDTVLRLEREALFQGSLSVVLCSSDKDYLLQNLCNGMRPNIKVLLPPLRQEMEKIPTAEDVNQETCDLFVQRRSYITCCVRLSEEKEPQNFVKIIKLLKTSGELEKHKLTPVIVSSTTTSFADKIKCDIKEVCRQSIIIDDFLSPSKLAEVFSKSLLNVHSCLYDAYGMTIVEAASQGCPSLVHDSGSIGATHLLSEKEHISVDLALEDNVLLNKLIETLQNKDNLWRVGQAASKQARAYTEKANAEQLIQMLQEL